MRSHLSVSLGRAGQIAHHVQIARRFGAVVSLIALAGSLAACGASGGIPGLGGGDPGGASIPVLGATSANSIGTGPVKVGLLLPLSNPNGQAPAAALRNAAELAITEFNGQELTLIVKDDKGTAEGGAAAAKAAISEGAELLIGPLFSASVSGAASVAKTAGRPMIAFSSDQSVAADGVYLLSFLPQADVSRIVRFAASKGKKSFVVLAPQTPYGEITAAAFEQAVAAASGTRIVAVQRYPAGGLAAALQAVGPSLASADTIFIPDTGASIAAIGPALKTAGVGGRLQLLGTGQLAEGGAALAGAWYPAPDAAGFASFTNRYNAKFGASPPRVATLAYDAVALANVLTRTQGPARFSTGILTTASGFGGQDGVFRFKADGTNDRSLAVFQLGASGAKIISPAPKSFSKSGT